MAIDSNSALLNIDRLTATSIPASQFEDPNLLGSAPRASSLVSAATPSFSARAATPADIDIETIGANWIAQGPAPINVGQPTFNVNGFPIGVRNGSAAGALDNQVAGAIRTVVVNPNDPNTLWVGTVNGGIWRTNTANQATPTWTPLTDEFRGLSIGAMALDPTDGQAIVAGIGHYSSYYGIGGSLIGLLLSTDGGDTFTEVGLKNLNISGVAKRGDIILASTNAGVYRGIRDTNTGVWTFTTATDVTNDSNPVSLTGNAFDLVSDPTDNQRFYTAVAGGGIFLSTDSGLNWTNISAVDPILNNRILTNNTNTKIAASPVNGRIYVGVIQSNVEGPDADVPSGNRPVYIGFREKQGTNWTQMDLPITPDQRGLNPEEGEEEEETGGQGVIHFSIVADHTDANTVYVGGDRQRLFRGSTIPNPVNPGGQASIDTTGDGVPDLSPQWQLLFGTGATANNSAPHFDSRHMTFDRNGNLIEVDDGGIYRRTNPQNNTGDWFSLNGNLQITEQHDIAYDPYSGIIISGNQDNGTSQQTATGSQIWTLTLGADGGDVAVTPDPTNAARTVRYFSAQSLGDFTREIYDSNNVAQSGTRTAISLTVAEAQGKTLTSKGFDTGQFIQHFELNAVDPMRMLIGTNFLYESFDQGNNLTSLGGLNDLNSDTIDNDQDGKVDEKDKDEFTPAGSIGSIYAIAYGGQLNSTPNADVAYVGSTTGLRLRTARTAGNLSDFAELTAYSGGTPLDIELDSNNWMTAFVLDNNNQVYQTSNAGTSWTNITGDLFSTLNLQSGDYLKSIEFVDSPILNALVLGTSQGVFATLSANWGDWFQVGSATLPNAPVWDMDYNRDDPLPNDNIQTANVLVAGTLGRGAWLLSNITNALNSAPRPNGGTSYDVDEGSSVVLTASGSSDPNGLALTYTWDLDGDGIFGETGLSAIRGNEVGINPTFSAAKLDGPRNRPTVKLRVTNSEGSSAVDKNIQINVKNVAPTINGLALSSTVINENDTITLTGSFIDPGILDTHKVTINWGDGTSSQIQGTRILQQLDKVTRTFQLSHQYLDDLPSGTPSDLLPITVTVDDFDGGIAQASTAIQVNNINPVITSFTSNANFADRARAGKPVTINANFTDIGTLDTHRAFIDWGDGTPTQEVTIFQGSGSGTVQGSHSYAKGGAFTVKLTLNDDDTGINTASLRTIIIGTGPGPG
jgi:PKD domain